MFDVKSHAIPFDNWKSKNGINGQKKYFQQITSLLVAFHSNINIKLQ